MSTAVSHSELTQKKAEAHVDGFLHGMSRIGRGIGDVARFLLFLLYLVLVVISFWLWAISALFLLARLALHGAMTTLLWASGGLAPVAGRQPTLEDAAREVKLWWYRRHGTYSLFVHPIASHYVVVQRASRRFWHWSALRQMLAVAAALVFIVLPGLYIVPRPHYVQITDDNVIDHHQGQVRYLIHGVDLFEPGQTREYMNERAPWLGKINPQGVKSEIQPGRFYRLWVIGIRWYWLPTLYPNIIGVTEVDAQGETLETPSHFVAPTTTGVAQ
jgi:hypothetical protein